MKRLEDLEVWKKGIDLAVTIYRVTAQGSIEKDWGLKDQIRRAAVSIPANIAEGFERSTTGDYNRFVLIAKGSCGELRTHLIIANRIGYLPSDEVNPLITTCIDISSMLSGLSRYLTSNEKLPKS